MKLDVVWWKSVGVVFTAGILIAGCGKSKPAPATDIGSGADTTGVGDTGTPPDRTGEDTQYVDPNQEYAGILRPIRFEYNRYRITEESIPTLEGIAKLLNENSGWKVLIEGHCDERGTNEYNLTLGEQRAQSTKRYLTSLGVEDARLQTVSYGEERPENPGHDESAWAQNRRAEFKVEAPRS
jgi:peptidoglycan-associated lipoprotein